MRTAHSTQDENDVIDGDGLGFGNEKREPGKKASKVEEPGVQHGPLREVELLEPEAARKVDR